MNIWLSLLVVVFVCLVLLLVVEIFFLKKILKSLTTQFSFIDIY